MSEQFNAIVNFNVKNYKAGVLSAEELGNKITWAVAAKYNFAEISTIESTRIEKSSTLAGPFVELATKDVKVCQVIDNDGLPSDFYRIVMIDAHGAESIPSLPKCALDPEMATVYGRVRKLTGQPIHEADIIFTLVRPPRAASEKSFVSTQPEVVYTGPDGYFEVQLVRGIIVSIESKRLGLFGKEVIIPATGDFLNLTDLL